MHDYIYNQNWHDLQDLETERYRTPIIENQSIKFVTNLDNSYEYIRIDPDDVDHLPNTDPNYKKQFYLIINGFFQYDTIDTSKKSITTIETLDDAIMRFYDVGDYPVQVIIE